MPAVVASVVNLVEPVRWASEHTCGALSGFCSLRREDCVHHHFLAGILDFKWTGPQTCAHHSFLLNVDVI